MPLKFLSPSDEWLHPPRHRGEGLGRSRCRTLSTKPLTKGHVLPSFLLSSLQSCWKCTLCPRNAQSLRQTSWNSKQCSNDLVGCLTHPQFYPTTLERLKHKLYLLPVTLHLSHTLEFAGRRKSFAERRWRWLTTTTYKFCKTPLFLSGFLRNYLKVLGHSRHIKSYYYSQPPPLLPLPYKRVRSRATRQFDHFTSPFFFIVQKLFVDNLHNCRCIWIQPCYILLLLLLSSALFLCLSRNWERMRERKCQTPVCNLRHISTLMWNYVGFCGK